LNKEVEDMGRDVGKLREEFDDVEMRVLDTEMSLKGAHTMIKSTKDEVTRVWQEFNDMNDSLANFSNQLEVVCQEDVSWCRSRITALEKPNNPANRSLWDLVNSMANRLDRQEDRIAGLEAGLTQAREKIGSLEMSATLSRGRITTLEEVMEAAPTPTDLTSEDEEYADVDDGGAMMVEDSEDERENMPPPPMVIWTATPHPAPVLRELIPIEEPAPAPATEVDAKGEDDAWYIPPIMRRRIHALDEYTTSMVEPVPEYVESRAEDPMAGASREDLPADGSGDEMWANLGVLFQNRS
jgi:predicted  nucleic acid-binding Zn-ribbon protein